MKILQLLSPTCKQVSRLQSQALEGKLSFAQRAGLRMHLMLCKWCRRYAKQIGFMHKSVHDHSDEVAECVPQKLSEEARERIKRKLHQEGK